MKLRTQIFSALVSASVMAVFGASACSSDDFKGCEASRSCGTSGAGGSGGASSGTGGTTTDGGEAGEGGSGGQAGEGSGGKGGGTGGTGGSDAGAAGAGGAPECAVDEDCDDDDPTNGLESCVDGSCESGNPPPTVVRVTPEDAETGIEPDGAIEIEFSEALDPDTVTTDSIGVLMAGRSVAGTVSYSGTTATFTPIERYVLLGEHTVSVSTEVTDADGAALLEPFESTFIVREGGWLAPVNLPEPRGGSATRLASDGAGNVLIAYSEPTGLSTRFYRPGSGWDDAELLSDCGNCGGLAVAANRAGAAMAAFVEDERVYVRQYRNGEWEEEALDVADANEPSPFVSIAMAPTGEAHVVIALTSGAGAGALITRRTDTAGAWLPAAQSASAAVPYDPPALAFDGAGNGLAVWANSEGGGARLSFSRYASDVGNWTARAAVAGSVAPTVGSPSIATDPSGNAVATWAGGSAPRLLASRFSSAAGWTTAEPVNGANDGMVFFPPALAFDGSSFVVAFNQTVSGGDPGVFLSRLEGEDWTTPLPINDEDTPVTYYWQPFLGADDAGSLIVVWRSELDQDFYAEILFRRLAEGQWSDPAPVFPALVHLDDRDSTFIMSPSGVAAVSYNRQLPNSGNRESPIAIFE